MHLQNLLYRYCLQPCPTQLHLTISHVLILLPESMYSNCTKPAPRGQGVVSPRIHSSVLTLCTPAPFVPSAVKSASTQMRSPAQVVSWFTHQLLDFVCSDFAAHLILLLFLF